MLSRKNVGKGLTKFSLTLLTAIGAAASASALSLGSDFASDFTVTDLGSPAGVPTRLGGLTLKPSDPDTLLIGGNANTSSGRLYEIGVSRDGSGSIDGFTGTATSFGDVGEFNDGGVTFGPDGVLFTARWPSNELGQTKPGSTNEDRIDALGGLGIGGSSISAINFVPAGFAGAGTAKVVTWNSGQFWDLSLAPDGSGTFDITGATRVDLDPMTPVVDNLSGGPEGFVYIDGSNPGFGGVDSMLVSDFSSDRVSAYEIDSIGNPVLSTRRDFITGLNGAEGAFIDPLTGDFLFSTFGGGDRVVRVSGFSAPTPPPAPVPLPAGGILLLTALGGLGGAGALRRRRKEV